MKMFKKNKPRLQPFQRSSLANLGLRSCQMRLRDLSNPSRKVQYDSTFAESIRFFRIPILAQEMYNHFYLKYFYQKV